MTLDPDIMDEQLGIDRTKLAERYQRVQTEEQKPARQIRFNTTYDEGTQQQEDFDPQEVQKQIQQQQQEYQPPVQRAPQPEPERPNMARPGKANGQDFEVFPGGPLQSEIIAWKKQFGKIYQLEIEGEIYIWRQINRFEYKEVMALGNTNELTREEAICEICVLFPYDYSYVHMVNGPGGVPSQLAEQIMKKSGFTRNVRVIPL